MDTSDPDIRFDAEGVSNHWHEYRRASEQLPAPAERQALLERTLARVKQGRSKQYDCIIGLSGGVDSSYVALKAVELGLKPLAVHFDNGWNSQLATKNIESIVRTLGLDLETYVMDWEEFRDVQRAYFKASVVDLEVPTDHMIAGAIHKIANQRDIKFFLDGCNFVGESIMPRSWNYRKQDLRNLRAIHSAYGTRPLRRLPATGVWHQAWYRARYGRESIRLLDLSEYNPLAARQELADKVGWRDYGGKHHESIFTRFYQGYILPRKFGIDKRKAHYSNLICAGFMTRDAAVAKLAEPAYDARLQAEDQTYVAKKLGFSDQEMEDVLALPNRKHEEFATDELDRQRYWKLMSLISPVLRRVRSIRGR